MPPVWQRHPRYALVLGVIILATFYLIGPYQGAPPFNPRFITDNDLPGRLARSDRIYKKTLQDRQGLIQKFGPRPSDVATFPPDKSPWPPYTVWDFFPPAYNCPHEVQRVGSLGDGGKWVCGLSRVERKPDCIIYSVGINYESSFEAEILENTESCEVWGYDFSVKSFGPQIPENYARRTHFFPYGLGGVDKHEEDPPMYTLDTLLKINKHTHIDILKIDIEGWEFETLTSLIKPYLESGEPLPFGQLQLEIHIWNKKFPEFLQWWESLEAAGLRPFMTEPNLVYQNYNKQGNTDLAEYSFLNVRGDNIFIKDPKASIDEDEQDFHHPHGPHP